MASGGAPGGARGPRRGPGGRGPRARGKRAYDTADFANLPVPDELLKFNALLQAERQAKGREKKERRAAEAQAKALSDAEKAKDDAAARVRALQGDSSPPARPRTRPTRPTRRHWPASSDAARGQAARAPGHRTDEVGEPVDVVADEPAAAGDTPSEDSEPAEETPAEAPAEEPMRSEPRHDR